MFRVRTVLTGSTGSPYYSNLYFLGPTGTQTVMDAVVAMWTALAAVTANDLTAEVEGETANIDAATGEILDFTALTGATIPMTNTGARMSRATQGLIQFRTAGVVNGRRVLGRMYHPGITIGQNSDGEPAASYLTAVGNAYNNNLQTAAVRDTNPHIIWARPFPGSVTEPARSGSQHIVQDASVWNEWAIQRSRRD